MSFFDDASLAFLPSGAAGKDGKAYSIKPVPEYGSELVTNGDFATDSDWIKESGWTISGGSASCDGSQSGNSILYQNISHSANKKYRVEFTISGYVSGQVDFALDTPFFGATSSNGTFVFDGNPPSGGNFIIRADADFVGSVDNVSVKEITNSGDFTFSRGSNLAATRVGPTGLIEKGRENLLLRSNEFDNSYWIKSNATLTSGQSGYDGSTNAFKVDFIGGTASYVRRNETFSVKISTISFYLKAGTHNFIQILNSPSGQHFANFDISNGVTGNKGSGIIDSNITDVGNGWYRCSMTADFSAQVAYFVWPVNLITSSWANIATTSGNYYIQDAQMEIGLAATDYIESGATTGKAGLLEDEPRFDYSGGATCPSLLLEPSRTNLVPYTEYLSGLTLGNSPTLTQNYAISPEGVKNAVRIQDTDGSNFKTIQTQFSITSGSTYTISVYVKKATSPISTYGGFYFDFDGGTRKTSNLIFDEYNGTLVNASGNAITSVIHPVIDEGDYWRFSATATDTGSNSLLRPTLRAGASANGTSVSLAIKDYTAYGFQVEAGSYPTSYIPNHSGTGSVTRGADDLSLTGASSLIGQTEGTMFFEGSVEYTPQNVSIMNFNQTLLFSVALLKAANNKINAFVYNGGSVVFNIVSAATSGKFKCAVAYKSGDTAFYVNGTQVGVNTTTFTPAAGLDEVYIGTYGSPYFAYDHPVECNQALLFDTRLSNADLATLTTL